MKSKLTICTCRWRHIIPQEQIDALVEQARAEEREVVIVDDLCELVGRGEEADLAALAGSTIIACHERAVKSLMDWRGIEVEKIVNLREGVGDPGPGNDAWFPVIDKERCTECGKCFDFCPFGVYDMIDDRIRVVHPTNCKNNCPACARNCPSEAIIFPKYGRSPINGGLEQEEKLQRDAMAAMGGKTSGMQAFRVDHSTLYADALRARLLERRSLGGPLFKVKKEDRD